MKSIKSKSLNIKLKVRKYYFRMVIATESMYKIYRECLTLC